jgi:hypothetical protein
MAGQTPKKKRGCSGCIMPAAFGLMALLLLLAFAGRDRGPTPPPIAPAPARASRFKAGERAALLRPGGAGHAHVAIDRDAFAELLGADASGDLATFRRLGEEGRVLRINNGTLALIVEPGPSASFVRVLEGDRKGSTGWVEDRYLHTSSEPAPGD